MIKNDFSDMTNCNTFSVAPSTINENRSKHAFPLNTTFPKVNNFKNVLNSAKNSAFVLARICQNLEVSFSHTIGSTSFGRKPLDRPTFDRKHFARVTILLHSHDYGKSPFALRECRPNVCRTNVCRPNGFRRKGVEPRQCL